MRILFAGLSLVGLLIAVAFWAHMFATDAKMASDVRKNLNGPANQIAGRGEDGTPALDSITLSAGNVGGHLRSLVVMDIVPGGAMEKVYGLKKGDEILEAGDYTIGINDDLDTAKSMLLVKYGGGLPLKVRRAGAEIMLPLAGAVTAPLSPEQALRNQLNQIQNQGR
jgi:hypothetical protein